jgi:hypothetical protein
VGFKVGFIVGLTVGVTVGRDMEPTGARKGVDVVIVEGSGVGDPAS